MNNTSVLILKYSTQVGNDYLQKYPGCVVEDIPNEEWLSLIHFKEEEIPFMSLSEVLRRIAALRSIEGAPHFCFNWELKDNPEFKEFVKSTFEYSLNGNANSKIVQLENVLLNNWLNLF